MQPAGRAALCALALVLILGAPPAQAQLSLPVLSPPPDRQENGEEQVAPGGRYSNPVVPGDYPDPSVIRVGSEYWAVATSGGWQPPFAVLHSKDLVNWDITGSVLRNRPLWAQSHFWAPEIVSHGRGFLVYYSALSTWGRFCVGVASARSPAGFFRDRGPVVCPRLGAIDPLPAHDERGRPYLIWKEDGNARGRPTPIKAARLSRDGLRLAGRVRELFRNDAAWEGGVVEGTALARHDGRMYLFYSARGCCGERCDYATGVARSPTLLGRWEKHPEPVLKGNDRFRCPGHGSAVDTPGGEHYFVYHAYTASGSTDVGRQMLLDRIEWTPSGWPVIGRDRGPSPDAASPGGAVQHPRADRQVDEFDHRFLGPGWQWTGPRPRLRLQPRAGGRLLLGQARRGRRRLPGVVGRQPGGASFMAETVVGHHAPQASAGLAVYADDAHAVGIQVSPQGWVKLWRRPDASRPGLAALRIGPREATGLRVRTVGRRIFAFEVGTEAGWQRLGGAYPAPPWRGELRVVLRVSGPRGAWAAFERFALAPLP